ncbi:type IX secretion system sortase PorU [Rufibacter roseus]|uniref:Type IX secretion system sortase PorU n=1 Tax=Rufibacter roseus TaxID=1567108 RepID=A0ABW2DHB8_9BACT|nr:type IX secretion system sortase PorU [Rufibacter roseus]
MRLLRKSLFVAVNFWAFVATAWAQSEDSRVIHWRNAPATAFGLSATPPAAPTFDEAAYNSGEGVPYYVLTISNAAVTSFEFVQAEFAPLTAAEARYFPSKELKSQLDPTITTGTANRVPMSTIFFKALRLNPQTGAPEKLVKFSYRYQTGGNTQRRPTNQTFARRNYATTSVLSSGDWYKIGVTASGIYKIDRATLQAMGINAQSVNPKNLKLYGNGGGMLPQPNSAPRIDDLKENAIWVQGESDNSFDNSDYILFYGEGPHTWSHTPNAPSPFTHSYNLYSDTTYYYLHVGATAGKRIAPASSVSGSFPVISSFDERAFHEQDLVNRVNSGREWYGEEFNNFTKERSFTFPVTDLVPNTPVKITSSVLGFYLSNGSFVNVNPFTVTLNGAEVGKHSLNSIVISDYNLQGRNDTRHFNGIPSGNNGLNISYTFHPGSFSTATGFLNYVAIVAQRQLKLFGNSTSFRSTESLKQPFSTFQIAGVPSASDFKIWNITNPLEPLNQQYSVNNGTAVFSASSSQLHEYIAFQGNSFPAPTFVKKVANQNLHSLSGENIDLVIIAHPAFLTQARRLADHRRTKTGLQVEVVPLPQIYEEFSSGRQDITAIRDFMKMLYDRSNKRGEQQLKLLLFGDASFDYKNRLPQNTNFVPIYESRQSLDPIESYSSDDYYGFLAEEEGEWSETDFSQSRNHYLDVGIGRLPAKSAAEADLMVDKIIGYESPQTFGNWRKRLVFLADDGDGNEHLLDAENLAEKNVEQQHPEYLAQKIYLDLYPQISVPNGKRSPETNRNLREAIEKGALLVNYTGHGNVVSLAEEQILTINEIQSWKNADKLTFLLTATCEFGRYDDPRRNSGAETALLHAGGGAVGMVTTTRPVYSNGNKKFNSEFFNVLFVPTADGSMPDLGLLLAKAKNNSLGYRVNNRNFALLGDPSMTLAYPELKVALSTINGKPVTAATTDTLKALAKVTMEGMVTNAHGQTVNDFQGQVHVTVFDKRTSVTTLGDEPRDTKREVMVRNNVLYDGLASVHNGLFKISFVVPKDINYQVGFGSIHLYAFSSTTDGHGAAVAPVGSADATVSADNTPPDIQLYINDESFVSGGITGKDGIILAHLFDDNGINTAGAGIGHEITAVLDDKNSEPLLLNEFYTADVDSYQSGKVRYPFKDLAPGPHTLQLKAWDTHNNSSTSKIEFIVASTEQLALEHVFNVPNPFVSSTTFQFDHNRAGQELDVLIQIFTVSGKLVKTLHGISDGSSHFSGITWDGRDDYYDVLAKGVYIYKLNVRSRLDGATTSRFEKLVLLK